jgi:hypothetical protein
VRRKTCAAIFLALSLLLFGCEQMPTRPDPIEVCQVDAREFDEAGQPRKADCICGSVGHPEVPMVRKPLFPYCDKATAFPPAEWEKFANWQDDLLAWGKRMERECRKR